LTLGDDVAIHRLVELFALSAWWKIKRLVERENLEVIAMRAGWACGQS